MTYLLPAVFFFSKYSFNDSSGKAHTNASNCSCQTVFSSIVQIAVCMNSLYRYTRSFVYQPLILAFVTGISECAFSHHR